MPEGYPSLEALSAGGWLPVPRERLPFRSIVAASRNDPLAVLRPRRWRWPRDWGSECVDLGAVGHLNPASGYGEWPGADALIEALSQPAAAPMRQLERAESSATAGSERVARSPRKDDSMAKAIRFHADRRPRGAGAPDRRGRRARPGPGARAPQLRRGQLHRHLLPHRALSAAAAQRARQRCGRRRRGGRRRRHRHPCRRPRRLPARPAGRVLRCPRDAGRRPDPAARRRVRPRPPRR